MSEANHTFIIDHSKGRLKIELFIGKKAAIALYTGTRVPVENTINAIVIAAFFNEVAACIPKGLPLHKLGTELEADSFYPG